MMDIIKLNAIAFNQTFQPPMQDVTKTAEQLLDIWHYVDAIPFVDFDGFTLGDVAYVYLNPTGLYQHILIATEDQNVFLVVVIDVLNKGIYGHHLLNLIELYGLAEESE
ncbi:hypothetical protein QMK33_10635 [Hymenobacter sp. H14-R3]|uniref:hypothetical protein n=1 Tax=Hymenobacter sp. H14-R3 TaxID=3046308 RepID=UPI0024B8A22E|nr:hypothetical protein [Hymenobacter sp. H14-R3]MDJ0365610.1 hypothetical protein [Hymenobacter sp. H14-R3]